MAFDRPTTSRPAPRSFQRPAGPARPRFDIRLIAALLSRPDGYAAYAGIGSRETPPDVLADMRLIGAKLALRRFTLRSGGADGADLAFEEVAPGRLAGKAARPREIYVPWKGFNLPQHLKATDDRLYPALGIDRLIEDIAGLRGTGTPEGAQTTFPPMTDEQRRLVDIRLRAQAIAAQAHPTWDRCSPGAKALHTRNVHQVLGMDLDSPVRFVVAWTVDGGPTGGTGQAIRIADELGIPVLNLHDRAVREEVLRILVAA